MQQVLLSVICFEKRGETFIFFLDLKSVLILLTADTKLFMTMEKLFEMLDFLSELKLLPSKYSQKIAIS